MTFTEETAALALTRYPGLTQSQGLAVVRYYGSALAAMEDASPAEERWARLSQDKAARLSAYDFAQRQAEWCAETGVRVLPLSHPDYPALLRDCPDPPAVLYYQGTARLNRRHSLSVVGTRRITDYGKRLCADLMAGLSALLPDTLVVSGLAYGVDIHAHRAALAGGLETVAVLAHGLDRVYPAMHKETARAMTAHGGLLTEYPVRTEPDKGNFVRRNRIVAGLSTATLVVESAGQGGALITARLAGGYGREVMACPGRAGDEYSQGCNELIRDNKASLVTSAEDILALLGWERAAAPLSASGEPQLFPTRTPEEERVLDALHGTDGLTRDQLALRTGFPVSRLGALLFDLEMDGAVTKAAGNRYRL